MKLLIVYSNDLHVVLISENGTTFRDDMVETIRLLVFEQRYVVAIITGLCPVWDYSSH